MRLPPPAADAVPLALALAALAAWSWGTWPDVLVDFGRELYVAWRLSAGDVLYRDVASFYGPLSPYVNAALFRVFGVGLRTLALANLLLLGLTTWLLRALLLRAGAGRLAAGAAALVFLGVFGFGHLVLSGSFNFVCPYAHEATHGFLLALAALACALRTQDVAPGLPPARAARLPLLSGLLCGLAFLTKPESFVAGLGACALGLLLATRRWTRAARLLSAGAFALGLLLPAAVAFALLARVLPVEEAARGLLGSWIYLGNRDLFQLRYFAWSMGLDDPAHSLGRLLLAAARTLGLLAPAAALAWALRRRAPLPRWAPAAAALATMAALAPFWRARWWFELARPLPLWTLAVLAAAALALRRAGDEAAARAAAARLCLAVFALLLLPRIIFNARVFHYGFVLAAPAALLTVAALLSWIPRRLEAAGAPGRLFAGVAAGALVMALVFHLSESHSRQAVMLYEVGEGADHFWADERGGYVGAVLGSFAEITPPPRTLVVLPEGVMINYLLRRTSSVPYLTMLPSDEAQFGEDELLGSLQRRPPDALALVHRDTAEFGPTFFGTDYAQRTLGWIHTRYTPLFVAGDRPLRPQARFGIAVLRRAGTEAAP
jgi:hypothetical protein